MQIEYTPPSPIRKSLTHGQLLKLKNDLWNVVNSHFVKLIMQNRTLEHRALRNFVSYIWSSVFEDSYEGMPYFATDLSTDMRDRFFAGSLPDVLLFIGMVAKCPVHGFTAHLFESQCNEVLNGYGLEFSPVKNFSTIAEHMCRPLALSHVA